MKPLPPLLPAQADGADPSAHVWVSASAGAGKTQLLAARVLRLLLSGVRPERILALTFTKAAAAEMRARVLARLAHWASAPDAAIAADLAALHRDPAPDALQTGGNHVQVAPNRLQTDARQGVSAPDSIENARALLARVLDCPGGLGIQTIHAFAAGLLASFPIEAGIPADFTVLDDRSAAELAEQALDEALARPPYAAFAEDLAALSVRHSESRLPNIFATLAEHGPALDRAEDPAAFTPLMRDVFDAPREGPAALVLEQAMVAFECGPLAAVVDLLKKQAHIESIRQWIACDGAGRCQTFPALLDVFATKTGTPRVETHKPDPARVGAVREGLEALEHLRRALDAADEAARHLRVGWAIRRARARLGQAGALTYDDIITAAAALLEQSDAADWVRLKLDQRIDHILVDEAQDTSDPQWRIARALYAEYFAGVGARAPASRTLFAVGDQKQSIFGFQGADPRVFAAERARLESLGAVIHDVALADNFRSAPAILTVVDAVLDRLGPDALALAAPVPAHRAARADEPGAVHLWPPVGALEDADDDADADGEDSERGWVSTNERAMATRLAHQIRRWIDERTPLPARGRAIAPGDILVLVRKRGPMIGALVAALHRHGIPVAGPDRLALTAPLAVADLLALVRFVLQPADDLSLAEVLVSPLVGLHQDELLAVGHPRGDKQTLWSALRDHESAAARAATTLLADALARADYLTPARFLEHLLSGPGQGRARILARLGEEARLALDELLSAALAFEAAHPPSLAGFLAWLAASDADLKRDPDAASGEVRIMTVHGAKGLQSPVVVLADAATPLRPDKHAHVVLSVDGAPLPIFHGGKPGRVGRVADACAKADAAAEEENRRLLYVALTRAEDLLCVGGHLGRKPKAEDTTSWHALVRTALETLGAAVTGEEEAPWGAPTLVYAPGGDARRLEAAAPPLDAAPPLPAWARAPAPAEARPPRPLTPSRLGADDAPQLPGGSAGARRGRLLHTLFERLPSTPTEARAAIGDAWLARAAPDMDTAERAALLADALAIVADPAHAALFGPGSLAEAPLAATLGANVIAAKVDRLLIEATRVLVVDFKTGARVPARLDAVPAAHIRQMAAYHAALARIFPGRAVEAALLYTSGPAWFALPAALLAAHAPAVD